MSKSGAKMPDGLPQGFPAGLRVLVVDDDRIVLRTLEAMLLQCGYKVTLADHAFKALEMLRANKDEYDIVITDVNMPDMDGFKLLEIIGLEMDLPVIMLSVDCGFEIVMKGLEHGAVGHLSKPARLEELKLIWTHVAKKSLGEKNDPKNTASSLDHASKQEEVQNLRPSRKSKDRRNEKDEEEEDSESEEEFSTQKRARVSWTKELHAKFIDAVKYLGIDRAVPKKILDIMQIPGLTRENVASHLQKYRKGLKKNAMGLSEQLFDEAGTSGHGGISMSMANNKQLPTLCSFDRSSAYRNISLASSYLHAHESRHSPAVGPSTWFPRPMRPQINLSRQYTMNSHGIQLGTQQLGTGRNSYMMKMPNPLPGYQSHAPSTSRLNFYANHCPGDGNTGSNSVQPHGYMLDQQAQTNGLLDSNCSNEIEAMLAFEQEQQHQFACVPVFEEEMGEQIARNSLDSVNHEDQRGNRSSDVTEYTDDLHVALKQFQR